MCEWEQGCMDNLLLFDPNYARHYIKERCSWFVSKQSMCAKCKLKLGEHLIPHQEQNQTTANNISLNHQCNDFDH